MLRITGGVLGGRRIRAPEGAVRPTQERVREALFSMLGERVVGSRFLDLFGGSGAVGLEAWSRGAAAVCWVERHPRVFAVLEANVKALCDGRIRLVRWEALRFLEKGLETEPFDIIFADPPYEKGPLGNREGRHSGRGRKERRGGTWAGTDSGETWAERRRGSEGRVQGAGGGWEQRLAEALRGNPILAAGGLLAVELAAGEPVVERHGWAVLNDRVYGDSRLRILQRR